MAAEGAPSIIISNIDSNVNHMIIKTIFNRYGPILGIASGPKKNTLEVFYEKMGSVLKACTTSDNAVIAGNKVRVTSGQKTTAPATKVQTPKKSPTERKPKSETKPNNSTRYKTCIHFLEGKCIRGDACNFYHKPQNPSTPSTKIRQNVGGSSIQVCRHFISGGCNSGDKCLYKHPNLRDEVSSDEESASKKRKITPPVKPVSAKKPKQEKKAEQLAPAEKQAAKCAECAVKDSEVRCKECDEGFCSGCDAAAHSSRVMSKHTRTPVAKKMQCKECRKREPSVECKSCDAMLCSKCSWSIHSFRILRAHKRLALDKAAAVAAQASARTAAPIPVTPVVQAQPEPEDGSSSCDSESEEEGKKQVQAKPEPVRQDGGVSSETSDSESDDSEAPKQVVAKPASESESSDSSDEEAEPKHTTINTPETDSDSSDSSDDEGNNPSTPAKTAPSKEESSDESSSDSDSSDDEAPATTPQKRKQPKQSPFKASGISSSSSHSLVKKIEDYAASDNTETLHLSANLNGYERLLAHDCAERLGLGHVSVGQGLERHITITKN